MFFVWLTGVRVASWSCMVKWPGRWWSDWQPTYINPSLWLVVVPVIYFMIGLCVGGEGLSKPSKDPLLHVTASGITNLWICSHFKVTAMKMLIAMHACRLRVSTNLQDYTNSTVIQSEKQKILGCMHGHTWLYCHTFHSFCHRLAQWVMKECVSELDFEFKKRIIAAWVSAL